MSAPVPNTLDRLDALRRRLTPRSYTGRAVLGAVTAMTVGLAFGGAARALKDAPPQPSLSITATADTATPATAKPATAIPATAIPATAKTPTAATPNVTARATQALAASVERSAVGVLAHRLSAQASDLAAEWRGTDVRYELKLELRAARQNPALGARLAGVVVGALMAVLAVGLGAFFGLRALLRRRARRADAIEAIEAADRPAVVDAPPTRTRFALPLPTLALRARLASVRRRRTTPAAPVIALAAAGTTPAEIARRTGLSRDAIALALSCSRMA